VFPEDINDLQEVLLTSAEARERVDHHPVQLPGSDLVQQARQPGTLRVLLRVA